MLWISIILTLAIVLMLLSLPIGFAFAVAALGMMVLFNLDHTFPMPTIFAQVNSFILMAVPFFIFAGGLMGAGGISKRIVAFADSIVGHFRGGLGIVTIVSSALFGTISGSSAATVSSIGLVLMPQMEKYGYPKSYTTALVACSGVLGQLIPPSIPMILFGMLTGASVAGCFLSTASSGILLVLVYIVINYIKCRKIDTIKLAEKQEIFTTLKKVAVSTKEASVALLMPVLVLGGIYGGFFTPTEAGCVAVVYALVAGAAYYRETTVKKFFAAAGETASIEGSVLFILFFIFIVCKIFVYQRVPEMIADAMLSISSNRIVILLLINLFLFILGALVDDVSGIMLAGPLLYPLFLKLGIHPFHMAVIIAVNQGSGQLTPPVASNLWIAARVSGLDVSQFVGKAMSFLLFGNLPVLLVVTFVPEFSLWLPRLVMGKI